MPRGVVLMTYGAPSGREDLPRYLAAIRGGRAPSEDLVAEMARRYDPPEMAEREIARFRTEPRVSLVLSPRRVHVHGEPR